MAKMTPRQQNKLRLVLHEFKTGDLRSSSGQKVTNRDQAIAIAINVASKLGAKKRPKP